MFLNKKSFLKRGSFFPFWIALVLVGGLVATFGLLASRFSFFKRPEKISNENSPLPQRVKITNVTDQEITISWISAEPSFGSVLFGSSKIDFEPLGQKLTFAFDQRGESTFSKSHFINLSNLKPDHIYYFLIKSGSLLFFKTLDGRWEEKGLPAEQITGSKNSQPQNLIQGQILTKNGLAVSEAFVFLEIPGKSTLLSAITDSNGEWQIDLAKLRSKDFHQPFKYLPGNDLFRFTIETSDGEVFSSYRPIPQFPNDQIIIDLN